MRYDKPLSRRIDLTPVWWSVFQAETKPAAWRLNPIAGIRRQLPNVLFTKYQHCIGFLTRSGSEPPLSGRHASTSTAAAVKPVWSRPRERETVRLAILDAANRLVDQHGIAALTLSAVASEAGIGRATIYGYFSGKQELLSLLSGETHLQQPAPAAPALKEEPEVTPAAPSEANSRTESAKLEAADETPAAAVERDVAGDYDQMMRLQAAELDKLAKRVIVPKSLMKEGTDAVLSRVETRLRLIEQSYAELQSRQSNDTKELAGQIGAAVDSVQQLQRRFEGFDNKHQLALAEIRLDVHNLTSRSTDVARPFQVAAGEAEPSASVEFAEAPPRAPSVLPVREPRAERAYLSSARQAAINATQQNVEKDQAEHASRRGRWVWLLGAIILAACAGIGLSLYLGAVRPASAVAVHEILQAGSSGYGQTRKTAPVTDRLDALAEAGNLQAQLILGLNLLNGTGVPMNIEKGANWIERAAIGGQGVAQNCLGVLYQTGTGVAASMIHAVHWYEAAARHGNLRAMTNLGKIHAGGWKDVTDFAEAARWFSLAAAMGDVDAQFNLAVLYERGDGVPYSLIDAYKWYAIAAAQGDRKAAAQVDALAGRLTQDELLVVKKAVTDFRRAPVRRADNDIPHVAELLAAANATYR